MKVIEFTPLELINMIDNSNNLELSGGYGSLFLWNGNLIKLDNQLYSVIDSISKNEIESRIKGINLYASKYKDNPYISTEQIAYLLEKQPNIRLTDFDLGVVKVNGTVCGTILPNHLDYDNLKNLKTDNPTLVYKILKNVFLALSELEENQIYHLDLYKEKYLKPNINILYKDSEIKLCDLSGEYIAYGENYCATIMYEEFLKLLDYLLRELRENNPIYYILLNFLRDFLAEHEIHDKKDSLFALTKFGNFIIDGVKTLGINEEDIAISKEELKNKPKKIYCGNLSLNEKELKDLFIPSEIVYGKLEVEGNKIIKDVTFPKTILNGLKISGVEVLENVVLPEIIKSSMTLNDVLYLKNVTLPKQVLYSVYLPDLIYLENISFANINTSLFMKKIKVMKNVTFAPKFEYLDLNSLEQMENVTLPRNLSILNLESISTLKDVLLPDTIFYRLTLKSLDSLNGALVSDNVSNYKIEVNNNFYNLFDLMEQYDIRKVATKEL